MNFFKILKLKHQITFLVTLALVIPAIVITSVSIYKIKSKATSDIEEYRKDEFDKIKIYMKHITDIAYGMMEVEYRQVKDSIANNPDQNQAQLMENCLYQLSQIRFDKGKGYFWVTDTKLPFPTMLMHAEKSNLKGVELSDSKYNVEKESGKNIYAVRAERASSNGDAFVEYTMKKPGSDSIFNKISYSRLFKPLGWVVSTGFYTDQIDYSVEQKRQALDDQLSGIIWSIIVLSIAILLAGLFVSNYFSNELAGAINLIKDKLKELSEGKQVDEVTTERTDEVGEMTLSLNMLVNGLRRYTSFAKEIGQGNFEESFTVLSERDVLGNELLVMKENLLLADKEKNLREWTNEGLAKLGDVLRKNNSDTKELVNQVLKELVKYMNVNQGAFFVITDNTKEELELMATYAYGKQKFVSKTVGFRDGLVGQCVLERDTIYMSDVPQNYIHITSGLGDAPPKTILIVPLIHNEIVYGVLELASFRLFEPHHIAFIEKIAESTASTISTVQVNENTKLLLEKSQLMQEELRAQEEEMRQNMEELSATQEQFSRQVEENNISQKEMELREKAFFINNLTMEMSNKGIIKMVNDKLCSVSKFSRADLIGKQDTILYHSDTDPSLIQTMWQNLRNNLVFKSVLKFNTNDGGSFVAEMTAMPVKEEFEELSKCICTLYILPK